MKSRVACVRITSPDGQRSTYDLSAGRTTIERATPDGAPELALGPDPYGRFRADPAVGRRATVAHEQVK